MATKKTQDTGAELDIVDEDGQTVVPLGDTGLGAYLANEIQDVDIDTTGAYREIIGSILAKSSAMDVLTPTEVLSARQIVDRPFALMGVRFNGSDFSDGSGYYATMDVHFPDTDEKGVVNTGHQALMAQLIKLVEFNEFPYPVKVVAAGKPNQFGTVPLRLVAVNV